MSLKQPFYERFLIVMLLSEVHRTTKLFSRQQTQYLQNIALNFASYYNVWHPLLEF
jgi:hypothetical protein